MLLRSGREKPYEVSLHSRQPVKKQSLPRTVKTASGKSGNSFLSDGCVCNVGKMSPVQGRIQIKYVEHLIYNKVKNKNTWRNKKNENCL